MYVNEASVGEPDYLKTVPAGAVLEMHWLDPSKAANRFGYCGFLSLSTIATCPSVGP